MLQPIHSALAMGFHRRWRRIQTTLLHLPNELLLQIAANLNPQDLNSLLQTSSQLSTLLSPILLQRALTTRVGWQVRSVLHWAASHNRLPLMALLLQRGDTVDKTDIMGMTALHSAVLRGHEAAVEMILSNGGKQDEESGLGWTPLLLAVCSGNLGVVHALLRGGAAVDLAPSLFGAQNAMHHAAALGHGAVLDGLLAVGCKRGARDVHGVDALGSAELFGQEQIVKRLVEVGGFDTAGGRSGDGDAESRDDAMGVRSATSTRHHIYMYEKCVGLDSDECRDCFQT